jgi:hypothetical protein
MGLALDEPRKSDKNLEIEGLNFVMDEREAQDMLRYGTLAVDYQGGWWGHSFVVQPSFGQACG